ncbi:MAG: hypothetical protein DMF89_17360 [Acidobacteria bacterium]|nr:MAG: hypothetical protein DMF89_17360 [Acidobacteriota bacterium]
MERCAVQRDFSGALQFNNHETRDLLLLVANYYVFAWSAGEDLNILPDDGSCILMVSHHGELQGDFPDSQRLDAFVAFMEAKGYPLPDDAPDETFKIPKWMGGRRDAS